MCIRDSFCALIGSAVGALFAGLLQVVAVSLGSAGFLGFLSINATSIPVSYTHLDVYKRQQ